MVWAVCAAIWLMAVAVVIAFFYGACGPDTEEKRQQDWEDLKKYMEERKRNKNKGRFQDLSHSRAMTVACHFN